MDEVCRFCTKYCTTLENIFDEREPTDNETHLIVMLGYCTTCEVRESDLMPQLICGPCISAAKNAYQFKLRCEQSQKYFKELINECEKSGVKYEMDDICRFCNISCPTLENIFVDREQADNESLLIMLEKSTSCDIKESDSLPQSICAPCISAAKNAFEFKLTCEQSQTYFEELLKGCEKKPDIDELSTGDWCITESTTSQVCIKQEKDGPASQVCIKEEIDDPEDEDYSEGSEGSSKSKAATDEDYSEDSGGSLIKEEISERKPNRRSKSPLKCSYCPEIFTGKVLLNRHTKQVHEAPKLHTCPTCNKNLASKNSLREHMRHVHSDESPYKCELCPKAFKSKTNLKLHSAIHSDECPYICEHCQKAFKRKMALRNHRVVHLEERPWQCEHCPKSFKTDLSLKLHFQNMHSVELPFKCKKCPLAFKTKLDLSLHKEFHVSERSFKCDLCPMAFKKRFGLDNHRPIHFSDRPFKCEKCPLAFKIKRELKRHQLIHTDERPYTCELCSKTFKWLDTLKRHRLTHSNERPFKCEECPRAFTIIGELNRHKKKAHSFA